MSKKSPKKKKTRTKVVTPEVVQERTSKSLMAGSAEGKALTPSDPVSQYLAEIRKYPLLTREQEQDIATRYYESKDPKLAEVLVTSNLRFVVKVAAEYSKFGARMIDLIQEGNVGLMHAVKEFNPYKGARVITYAVWWIRGHIQEYLMRQFSMVRIGTTQNQRKLFYQLQKKRDELEKLGVEAGIAQISGRLGIPEEDVKTMSQRLSGRDVSLNQPIEGDDKTTLMDFQSSSTEDNAETILERQEELHLLNENIEEIRDTLSEKEIFLLDNRLLSDVPMTLQEIGDKYGVTREAVRQMEVRLIKKIRSKMVG